MALTDVPTVDELAETTGQSKEQLKKDRDAVAKRAGSPDEQ